MDGVQPRCLRRFLGIASANGSEQLLVLLDDFRSAFLMLRHQSAITFKPDHHLIEQARSHGVAREIPHLRMEFQAGFKLQFHVARIRQGPDWRLMRSSGSSDTCPATKRSVTVIAINPSRCSRVMDSCSMFEIDSGWTSIDRLGSRWIRPIICA